MMFVNVKFAALFTLVVLAVPSFSAPIPVSEILPAPTEVPVITAYTARSDQVHSNPHPHGGRSFTPPSDDTPVMGPMIVDPVRRTDGEKGPSKPIDQRSFLNPADYAPQGGRVPRDAVDPVKREARKPPTDHAKPAGPPQTSGTRRDDLYSNGIGAVPEGNLQQVAQDLTNKMNAMVISNSLNQLMGHMGRDLEHRADDNLNSQAPENPFARFASFINSWSKDGKVNPYQQEVGHGRRDDPSSDAPQDGQDLAYLMSQAFGGGGSGPAGGVQRGGFATMGRRDDGAKQKAQPHSPSPDSKVAKEPRDGWSDMAQSMGGASLGTQGFGGTTLGHREEAQHPLSAHLPEQPRDGWADILRAMGGASPMSGKGLGASPVGQRDEQKPATHAPETPRNQFSTTVSDYRGGSGMSSSGMGSSGLGQRDEQKRATHTPEIPRNWFNDMVSNYKGGSGISSSSMTGSGVGHRSVQEARDLDGKAAKRATPLHTDGSGEVIRPFIQRSAQIAKRVMDLGCTGLEGEDAIKCSGSQTTSRLTHIQRASDMILNEVRNNKELLSAARDLVDKMKRALEEEAR